MGEHLGLKSESARGSGLMDSIYEFIQRRADWKKIEKTVDKVSPPLALHQEFADDLKGHVRFVSQGRLYDHVVLVLTMHLGPLK